MENTPQMNQNGGLKKNNTGSRRLAEKYGFKEDDNRGYNDYVRYTRKVNK